jgi:hypothetical protein
MDQETIEIPHLLTVLARFLRDQAKSVWKVRKYQYQGHHFSARFLRTQEQDSLVLVSQRNEFSDKRRYTPDIVDLPTPPFAEDTAMTFLTSLIGRFSGRPLCIRALKFGGVPDLGNPFYVLDQANDKQLQCECTNGFSCCNVLRHENNRFCIFVK